MLDDMPNVSMSLPRSKVNAALVSVGLSRSDLFDFCSGARFDIDWFDPLIDRVDVLSGLFGVTDLGLFPSQLPKSESESESESELESPHGKRVNINGGKDSSSEESESSKSESQPPATAHGPYRNGFSVSSLLLDRSDVDANSSESSPSISSHIVSVNSSPPPPQAAPALSPLSSESEILKRIIPLLDADIDATIWGERDVKGFSDSLSELLDSISKSLVKSGGGSSSLSSSDESINSLLTNLGISSSVVSSSSLGLDAHVGSPLSNQPSFGSGGPAQSQSSRPASARSFGCAWDGCPCLSGDTSCAHNMVSSASSGSDNRLPGLVESLGRVLATHTGPGTMTGRPGLPSVSVVDSKIVYRPGPSKPVSWIGKSRSDSDSDSSLEDSISSNSFRTFVMYWQRLMLARFASAGSMTPCLPVT